MDGKLKFCFVGLIFLFGVQCFGQSEIIPAMVKISDTMWVGKFEVTNKQMQNFLANQIDSVRANFIQSRNAYINSAIDPVYNDQSIEELYCDHPAFSECPTLFVSNELANTYVEWLNQLDSTKEYFVPSWEHYLAIYDIRWNEALCSPYMCALPTPLIFDSSIRTDTCITMNRDYFPWGRSIYGKKNRVNANLSIPLTFIIGSVPKKSFNSRDFENRPPWNEPLPVGTFRYNYKGIYDLQGNAAERIVNSNFTYGGSFLDQDATMGYIGILSSKSKPTRDIGFRVFAKPRI
jgi:formylglycine-generating enzyme required for sulfatase activity